MDLSRLSSKTLHAIEIYLNEQKRKLNEIKYDDIYIPYIKDEFIPKTPGPKLSNHEKNIIRQKTIKDIINDDEYQSLDVGTLTSETDLTENDFNSEKNSFKKFSDSNILNDDSDTDLTDNNYKLSTMEGGVMRMKLKPKKKSSKKTFFSDSPGDSDSETKFDSQSNSNNEESSNEAHVKKTQSRKSSTNKTRSTDNSEASAKSKNALVCASGDKIPCYDIDSSDASLDDQSDNRSDVPSDPSFVNSSKTKPKGKTTITKNSSKKMTKDALEKSQTIIKKSKVDNEEAKEGSMKTSPKGVKSTGTKTKSSVVTKSTTTSKNLKK
jgi:hypothetical protein